MIVFENHQMFIKTKMLRLDIATCDIQWNANFGWFADLHYGNISELQHCVLMNVSLCSFFTVVPSIVLVQVSKPHRSLIGTVSNMIWIL